MPWRRPWAVLLLVFVLMPVSSSVASDPFPRLWMMQGGYFNAGIRAHPELAALFLSPPSVIVGPYQLNPGGINRYQAVSYASYRIFRSVADGIYPIQRAMYDPERWPATPTVEQQHPTVFFPRFAAVAREHAWGVIMAPQPNLTLVTDAACRARGAQSEYDAFISCDLAGLAARNADIVDIQAQGLERDVPAYRAFVLSAATQARDANPTVRVVAELTTGEAASASDKYAAWASVRDVVDGYYLSISGNERLPVARAFMRMVLAARVR